VVCAAGDINSTDPILVGFSVPERQLEDIRRYQNEKDMRIEILSDRAGGAVVTGKLVFVDNTVTPPDRHGVAENARGKQQGADLARTIRQCAGGADD